MQNDLKKVTEKHLCIFKLFAQFSWAVKLGDAKVF